MRRCSWWSLRISSVMSTGPKGASRPARRRIRSWRRVGVPPGAGRRAAPRRPGGVAGARTAVSSATAIVLRHASTATWAGSARGSRTASTVAANTNASDRTTAATSARPSSPQQPQGSGSAQGKRDGPRGARRTRRTGPPPRPRRCEGRPPMLPAVLDRADRADGKDADAVEPHRAAEDQTRGEQPVGEQRGERARLADRVHAGQDEQKVPGHHDAEREHRRCTPRGHGPPVSTSPTTTSPLPVTSSTDTSSVTRSRALSHRSAGAQVRPSSGISARPAPNAVPASKPPHHGATSATHRAVRWAGRSSCTSADPCPSRTRTAVLLRGRPPRPRSAGPGARSAAAAAGGQADASGYHDPQDDDERPSDGVRGQRAHQGPEHDEDRPDDGSAEQFAGGEPPPRAARGPRAQQFR